MRIGGRDGVRPEKWEIIQFGSYNIRNYINMELESALRGTEKANGNLGEFQLKKAADRVCMQESSVYRVLVDDA